MVKAGLLTEPPSQHLGVLPHTFHETIGIFHSVTLPRVYIHTYTHKHIHVHRDIYKHIHICQHIHIQICIHKQAYTYKYTYRHIHSLE